MSLLTIKNLGVAVGDEEILKGVDLEIASGEVHVVICLLYTSPSPRD